MSRKILTARDLAKTYSVNIYRESYDDGWDCVKEYRRVMSYHQTNPQQSPYQIHNELDVPRKRVRGWIEGSVPDPVSAVNLANRRGWLDATWDSDIGRAFNILVTWVFASGSIGIRDLQLIFVIDHQQLEQFVRKALDVLGYGATLQRQNDPDRATQLVPRGKRTPVLARALSAMGAPIGEKSSIDGLQLPAYLESVPASILREFVELYVTLRGSKQDNRDGLELTESRSSQYHRKLAELIETVGGGSITPLSSGTGLWLSAETVSNLDLEPSW
jgi:hypothetical protein